MAYTPIGWLNDQAPAINQTNLNKMDNELTMLDAGLNYRDMVAYRNGGPIISSVSKSTYNASVTFANSSFLLTYRSKTNSKLKYVQVNVTDLTYNINNTKALVVDINNGNVSVVSNDSTVLETEKVMLMYCLFGILISPINNINSELELVQDSSETYKRLNTIICPTYLVANTSANDGRTISSITDGSNYAITVAFRKNMILGMKYSGKLQYMTLSTANQSYSLGNAQALVYDKTNNELSVKSMSNTSVNKDVAIVLANLYGIAVSPIAGLSDELCFHQINSPAMVTAAEALGYRDIAVMGSGGKKVFKSITKSGTTASIQFNGKIAFLKRNKNKSIYAESSTPASSYSIANTQQLVYETADKTFSVKSESAALTNTEILLVRNLWGLLVSPIASIEEELYEIQFPVVDPETNVTEVIITPDGSFCQVRDAVNAITDASSINRYRLVLQKGTYEEIDIVTKDYVDIVGVSRNDVILNCNGLSSELSPDDYSSGSEYSGIPINSMPKHARHLMRHMSNSSVKNLTMKSTATKYVIHQDARSNNFKAYVENCNLIRDDDYTDASNQTDYDRQLQNIVGVGSEAGQYQYYIDCNFISKLKNLPTNVETPADNRCAILWHNWNNKSAACGAKMENCNVFGCHIADVSELGSNQNDLFEIINTKTDNKKFGVIYRLQLGYYKINGEVVTDPDLVPYCVKLNVVGDDPNFVLIAKNRTLDVKSNINSFTFSVVPVSASVLQGQPVTIPYFPGEANDFGFAVQNSDNGFVVINTGNLGLGLCVADNYSFGDALYINNGYFTKTQSGNVVGYVRKAATLETNGLVEIYKA